MKKVRFMVFMLLGTAFAKPALAAPSGGGGSGIDLPPTPTTGFIGSQFITQLISKILPLVLVIGGFIAVVIIVISGIQFILSSGNPEGAAAARNRLVYAIVGFVVIILAFAVLQIVNNLFLGDTGIV